MKKIYFLLFVVILVMVSLSACTQAEETECPEWATDRLGRFCESASLSITPSETIGLINWQIGEIQLNDAYIYNVYGVQFFSADGQEINPSDLEEGIFYFFQKTESTGGFRVYPSDSHNALSPTTHLLLARPLP